MSHSYEWVYFFVSFLFGRTGFCSRQRSNPASSSIRLGECGKEELEFSSAHEVKIGA